MGKTYRKESQDSKRRSESQPGLRGNKAISHDRERTRKRRLLKEIEEHWSEDENDEYE